MSVNPVPPDRPIAFFDLDLTLLKVNSATLWVQSEYRRGMISTAQVMKAFWLLMRYRLGSTSLDESILSAILTLRGQKERDFEARVDDFYVRCVQDQIRHGAHQALQQHRDQGHLCYLMTSASSYLSGHFARDLDLDGICSQRFEVIDGVLTGRPLGGLCFGAGKLEHAYILLKQSTIKLSECFFYTDSFSDLPLLQAVGHPRVVHPDRKLSAYARQHSWQIHTW